ncbi:hypothetical protein Tco_1103292 [Tanacetum coccineum]
MIRVIELAVANDIAEPTNEGYPDLVSVDGSREVMQLGLDVAMQELYDHMHKIPVDRITNIEVGQRYLEADGLIASGERERELVCLIMLRPWRGATRGSQAVDVDIHEFDNTSVDSLILRIPDNSFLSYDGPDNRNMAQLLEGTHRG